MIHLAEYRTKAAQLPDYLPWAALVAPGVVLNKDGSFQKTAAFRGPDLESSTPAELMALTERVNSALRRLGSGWALFAEAQRVAANSYPTSQFPDPASALVDAERRAQFEEQGEHFESRYYLTVLWLPPADETSRISNLAVEGRPQRGVDPKAHLAHFIARAGGLLNLLKDGMAECRWLDDAETLTYLHSTISTNVQQVRVPETPMYLDVLLADQPLVGGLAPRLGDEHLRILSIVGFPSQTWPGLLDELNALGMSYRWMTRALCLDKVDAAKLLGRIRRQWFAKRKSVAAILKEVMTNEASVLLDNDAANKAADADAALQELGADDVNHAYVSATLVVSDEDSGQAEAKSAQVAKLIQGRDFTCVVESINAVDAWLGSLPGHVYANVRRHPVSTRNLAHMLPLSAVWAGPARDDHLQAPPLFLAKTDRSTPFRFSLHVGDLGHTLIVGLTGAGKSVLLALIALQFRRYAGARITAFDYGGSLRAATLACNGAWQDLGSGIADTDINAVALQPLADVDDTQARAWAADWLAQILAREQVRVTPEVKEYLWTAVISLASAPKPERTISGLCALLQSQQLKRALAPYCLGGPWGRLLDADTELLAASEFQCLETEGLIGTAAAPAVLAYLFHKIEAQLDGSPTLILIDEGWLVLDDASFGRQLREWLKTLRKKNASVIFATQSLADIDASPIAAHLIESCPTRILLPNARAFEPQIAALYRRFGLNTRQLEILATATPKRHYYVQQPHGRRLIDLGLGEVALAFVGAASKADHQMIDNLLAQHSPSDFAHAWLTARGLDWAADLLDPNHGDTR